MAHANEAIDSLDRLVKILYLPAEYPGLQRFLCYLPDDTHAERLVHALAKGLQARVPLATMQVFALWALDWSSREGLVKALADAMTNAAPGLAARLPRLANGNPRRRADQYLHALMDPPDDKPANVLTFVAAIPSGALRVDMLAAFSQLRGLMSASDHNWVLVAPLAITSYGEGIEHMSAFHTLFETYQVTFSPADLPDEMC